QRRFTGPVQAEYADLGAREEAQADVAQDVPLRRYDLGQAARRENVLGHGYRANAKGPAIMVASYRPGNPSAAPSLGLCFGRRCLAHEQTAIAPDPAALHAVQVFGYRHDERAPLRG